MMLKFLKNNLIGIIIIGILTGIIGNYIYDNYVKGEPPIPKDKSLFEEESALKKTKDTVVVVHKNENNDMRVSKSTHDDKKSIKPNFKITSNSIGNIVIGMTPEEALEIYSDNEKYGRKYYEGTIESSDVPITYITDKVSGEILVGFISFKKDKIWRLFTNSPLFKLDNGVHPGMKTSDYTDIYYGAYLFQDNSFLGYWFEYFLPSNMQGEKTKLLICPRHKNPFENNKYNYLGHYENSFTRDFKKEGYINTIEIVYKEYLE